VKRYISIVSLLCFISFLTIGCGVEKNTDDDLVIDIVEMSETLVGATMLNIINEPERYMGKTIRVAGTYQPFYWDEEDRYFHDLVIESQAGCCPKILEFILNDEDYPMVGTMIELVGIYSSYELNGQVFNYLAVETIKSLF